MKLLRKLDAAIPLIIRGVLPIVNARTISVARKLLFAAAAKNNRRFKNFQKKLWRSFATKD